MAAMETILIIRTGYQPLKCQSQQKSSAFLVCLNVKEASMANSVDPDQTAPIRAVCSGSTLFASILNLSVMLGNYLQIEDNFSRQNFQMYFFSWRFKGQQF